MHSKLEALKVEMVFNTLAERYMDQIFGGNLVISSHEFSRHKAKQDRIVRTLTQHGILRDDRSINTDYANVILKACDPIDILDGASVNFDKKNRPYLLWRSMTTNAKVNLFLEPSKFKLWYIDARNVLDDQFFTLTPNGVPVDQQSLAITYDDLAREYANRQMEEKAEDIGEVLSAAGLLHPKMEGMIPGRYDTFAADLEKEIVNIENTIKDLQEQLDRYKELKDKIAARGGVIQLREEFLKANLT